MTPDSAIWATLTRVFRDMFDDEQLNISAHTTAADVNGWDSLAHVQLLLVVEQTFGTRFNTGEIAGLANVGDMVALIKRRLQGSA